MKLLDIYDIFYSICLGLFIGGLIMAMISFILAEMSTSDNNVDHIDYIENLESSEGIGHLDKHIDKLDHIGKHIDKLDHIDKHIDTDHEVSYIEGENEINIITDIEPTPFMLIFSSSLLIFGFSGILFCYFLIDSIKFLSFVIPPFITYFFIKLIEISWRKIVKSRHYTIISTQNLIGMEGEVVLEVDNQGGVIKIPSKTPLRFEKVHVKPLYPNMQFKEGEKVYICNVKNNYLFVDSDMNSIRKMGTNINISDQEEYITPDLGLYPADTDSNQYINSIRKIGTNINISDQEEYITPDLGLYPANTDSNQYITPSLSDNDFFYTEEENNNVSESISESKDNESLPKDIVTSPEELFIDSDVSSLQINTELGLIQQEYAFDHQGEELADITVYLTITLSKTFLININFSTYPNKPLLKLPNEIKTLFGDLYQSLATLKNWNKKNPPHVVDIIHELEKKLFSIKKIETELNKITQEYENKRISGSISKIQVKLLAYGFKEYYLKIDLEPYPKLPTIELTSELRDIIWKPINELDSIKNWLENESESIDVIREISWLIDKHSRINFEIDLLGEHYNNINYDPLSNTINVDMKGKMKSEDLTFEFKIELPQDYPMRIPKITVLNEFDLEHHEKIKNDLSDSFKDFYNDWTPNHYLVDLFNLISKKIFEVSVVACVICHKIECPSCSERIASADEDSCHLECPYCERTYHKHCWEQTIKSFGKCGFCLKTPTLIGIM